MWTGGSSRGITGWVAEKALEECNIVINKNKIPGDTKSAFVTSGMRLGTNSLAHRGMGPGEMAHCADLVDRLLGALTTHGDRSYELDERIKTSVREEVRELCLRFPIPYYPAPAEPDAPGPSL